ncbi:beta strand repeat-containing protein [Rhodoflexus caldus]|uniref:beta strand repeat-containing protein n=1 Tax=Rhodoflexus caldus TaxID=2891236 RepID=UPI00202ABFC9|nr:hypothetical protein [Rhodoflexus caldus]
MNKNTFMYPVRMTAVLAAAALVTSCAKDKFTEANALDLELKRLRTEDSIRVARERQARIWDNNRLAYQRVLDSLDRINAGGRVFYTVTVVAGGNAAFGSGRVEELEGVQGATVSIAQYGNIVTQTTPASGMVTVELRAGSVSVVASAPNHTTVNYTANLTADGNSVTNGNLPQAPGNGRTIHVGNVIPLFPTTGAGTATVRGRAYIETDLTNETAEQVTPGVLGAGTNLFTANININDVFRARYLNIANQASAIPGGQEAAINRISYENATTNVVVDAAGNYSGVVPATASGLPIQLRYSQIAADRTFWAASFDNTNLGTLDLANRRTGAVITRRFIYGPGLTADRVFGDGPVANTNIVSASATFNTEIAAAQVTAAITRTGALRVGRPSWDPNNDYFILRTGTGIDGTDAAFEPAAADNGLYLTNVPAFGGNNYIQSSNPNQIQPPAVTFTPSPAGPAQTATGLVVLTDNGVAAADAPFKRIRGIRAVNAGSGYTTAPTGTFTRNDNTSATGNVTGTGSLQAPVDALSVIQVTNGGFGFLPQPYTSPAVVSTTGAWTGVNPTILFGGQNPLPVPKVTPTVQYSYNAVGTVNAIDVITVGAGLSAADVNIGFSYGAGAQLAPTQGVNGGAIPIALFETSPTGRVQFNFDNGGNALGGLVADSPYGNATTGITATTFTFFDNTGTAQYDGTGSNVVSPGTQPYVFVPTASFSGATATTLANAGVLPNINVSVLSANALANQGLVAEITLSGGGDAATVLGIAPGDPIANLGITINNPGSSQSLAAQGYLAGTGIDNYAFNVPSQNAGRFIPGPSTAASIFADGYPGYTPAGGSGARISNSAAATSQYARDNHTYIAKFSTPPTAPFLPAEGYPVFDNANRVVGLVITSKGAGYVQGQPITFEIVPNGEDANDVSTRLEAASLTFTIVNGGQYAAVPDVFISGGGLALAQQPSNASTLSNIGPPVPANGNITISNGAFDIRFNSTGVIQAITYNPAAAGAIPVNSWNTTEPLTVTLSSARQNLALNRAFQAYTGAVSATIATGAVSNVSLFPPSTGAGSATRPASGRWFEFGDITTPLSGFTATEDDYLRSQSFIIPPSVTINSATGTGATAVVNLFGGNIGSALNTGGGKIAGVTVTAGGSGYVVPVAGFNRNGRIIATYSGNAIDGFFRNFSILAPTDGNSGDNLTDFDAFSGVTYVRDVHYGTGAYFAVGQGR